MSAAYDVHMSPRKRAMIDMTGVAELTGLSYATIQKYRLRSEQYPFPEPDGYIGRTPWWWDASIKQWMKDRPGRGAGGGRPSSGD